MLTLERIEEIIGGIDFYLKRLDEFTMSMKEVKSTLEQIRHSQEKKYMWEQEKMRMELHSIRIQLEKRGLPEITEYEQTFQALKQLLLSDSWPKAVDPKLICTTEDLAFRRAHAILDLVIGESLEDKSFLDFGCGEGHVVMQGLTQNPKVAMGYDIDLSKCTFKENGHFTSEFDMIENFAPYDIILLQDVLDHVEKPVEILKKIKGILNKNGKVYIRNHPWCSRHGSHIYTQINKAFVHLIFDEAELSRVGGFINEPTAKIYQPLPTYRQWISDAGFKIFSEVPTQKNLDKFFEENSMIKERLSELWSGDHAKMLQNTQIEFVEYVLEPTSTGSEVI